MKLAFRTYVLYDSHRAFGEWPCCSDLTLCNPAQVLEGLEVEEHAAADSLGREHGRARAFRLRLRFAPPALYPPEAHLTFLEVHSSAVFSSWSGSTCAHAGHLLAPELCL